RQSDPKVEFLKPYQNNIYKKLTNETCSMGLEKTPNGTYIWSSSKQEIDYTYWSPDAIFNKTFIYGASTPKGWVLTQEPASCCLFEKEVEKLEPELTLTFDEYTYHLELTVTNFRGLKWVNSEVLLYCFTDANAENLLYRYPALNQKLRTNDTVVYDFKLNDDGPGRYWCESFRNLDLEVVKSNEFFFRESTIFYYEFVMILRVNYSQTLIHLNPLSSDIIEYLREFFDEMNFVSHLKDNYVTRFMKIIDIDEMKNEVLINIHLTYNIDGSNKNHDGEYEFTKTLIQEAIQRTVGIKLEMVDFLSSDYCLKKIDQKQTWPTTEVGRLAHSEEFCFKIDTSLVTSLCDGNFISGARWSISEEKCEIFNKSSVTPQLLPLIDQQPGSEAAMVIFDISTNHDLIYPFDVYAISEIFSKMFAIYRGDYITTFIETISNLMEIKRHVLLEARLKMNATDKILAIIDHIAAYSGENTEVCTKNLCFKFEIFHDWAGFGVPKGNTSRLMSISSNQTVDDIKNMNLDIGVWLSSPVLSQLEASPSLVILFFFKGSFFVENSTTDKSLGTVGRIILPYIEESLAGPIWVFQDVEDEITKACSFWNFDLLGFWRKDSDSVGYSSYQFCEFWRPSFFVLTDGNQDNMTESLIGILESNFKTPEVINRLHRLSRRHEEFGYIDVYLVGKILEKVHQDSGIDLKALVHTVSNLHQVQRKILEESQNLKWATDTILHYVDQILIKHNYDKQVNVTSDNFIILISDIKESNFSGLAFLGYNKTFQMQILEGDTEIEEVANYENLISAVVLSSELKKQLEEDAKVIVTFFPNDALFNENTTQSKDVSKIFGVTLPNIAKYSGPISVLHKATKSYYQNQCSYWYYNQSTAGLWLDDSESKYLSSVINCEFWHATHFALLLLDQDKFHDNALDWITNINCAISMVSLFCIILTAILFKKWRRNTGNQILLNFVFVIILQIGLLYVSGIINQNSQDDVLCTVTGLVLHYSVLSEFCWMLVISFLQYKRFVKILEGSPKRILFKACLCGWILPLLPVISVYVLYPDSYTHSKVRLCYPSGAGLYLGVWLPLSIIISVNFIVFGYVMYSVVYKKTECDNVGNNEILLHWRLGVLLFFLLGLTWTFGFMGQLGFVGFIYKLDMDKITVILLLCVIWLKNTALQIQVVCNTTFPHSSCVNKTEVLPFRECSNSCSKDSKCCYVHTEAPPRCPEGYIDSIQPNMCYRIQDQKSKFPPKCPFEDVLPFNYYKDVIDNIGPVWMP
ncbi:7tm 2 domain containing protein, partial [Asbolus verrucosus]